MLLKPTTITKIDQIFTSPLLQNCGALNNWPESFNILSVDQKQFADSIQSDAWENTLRSTFNIISGSIIENRSYRYYSDSLKPLIKNIGDLITSKINKSIVESAFAETSLKKMIDRTLVFIISNHCYENEYWEVIQQCNTDGLIHVLTAGHLPCGYEGSYPNGRILAY